MGRSYAYCWRSISAKRAVIIPLVIYLTSLAVVLNYAFTTNYLDVYDAGRGYELFNYYCTHSAWEPMVGIYQLQNTCLLTTYVPAIIQEHLHLPAELFFKWYIAIITALVPVVVYFLARKVVDRYAIFAALFIMGWVAFYQGGSYARSNFAMVLYGGLLVVLLSNLRAIYKYPLLTVISSLLVVAHYGAAIVGVMIIGGVLLMQLIKKRWHETISVTVCIVIITAGSIVWQAKINPEVWESISFMLDDTVQMARTSSSAATIQRSGGELINEPKNKIDNLLTNVKSRDKITQAAMGILHPDGDTSFKLNWWMFGWAWATIMVMLYGVWLSIRGALPYEWKALTIFSLLAVGLTILVPQISRGYGIEKVYYQALMVLAPHIVVGGQRIASKAKIPSYLFLAALIIPYVYLMQTYGIIRSILG